MNNTNLKIFYDMKMSELGEKAEQGGSVANHQFVRGFPQGPKSTF